MQKYCVYGQSSQWTEAHEAHWYRVTSPLQSALLQLATEVSQGLPSLPLMCTHDYKYMTRVESHLSLMRGLVT